MQTGKELLPADTQDVLNLKVSVNKSISTGIKYRYTIKCIEFDFSNY